MFSDGGVQDLAAEFVCVKIDPRDATPASMQHKSTRYVPELVILTLQGDRPIVLSRPTDLSIRGISTAFRSALAR